MVTGENAGPDRDARYRHDSWYSLLLEVSMLSSYGILGVPAGERAGFRLAQLRAFMLLPIVVVLAWQLGMWAGKPGFAKALAGGGLVQSASSLPAGTVLPLQLENTVSIKEARPGQLLKARIMQAVPLPNGVTIATKAAVSGSIVSVEKDSDGTGVMVSLKFDRIDERNEGYAISTYLRAIASFNAVRAAQLPRTGADDGTPTGWADTMQIGGDIRFGDGGDVRNHAKQKVGKGVIGGVLVRVAANPAKGCDGAVNGDVNPKALWVFSADACGVYDLKGVKVAHTGKEAPAVGIMLHFEKEDMKLDVGTGILLRIAPQT
jgi:hypothetical protein